MIKFIHTADIHFGMENYGKLDPKTGIHSRLLDFEKAFNFCIDRALNEKVDFFLFAGDAYKTATPSPTQQKLFLRSLLRLYKANIPVIIVIGNHDNPLSFGKANSLEIFSELPVDGFHVIAKPTSLQLQTQHGPINIVGIPWPTRNTISIGNVHSLKTASQITEYISKAVGSIIHDMAKKLDPSLPAILTGHLTVSNGIFSGSEKRAIYGTDPILLPSQLAISPFDYVGLGHLHRYQNLNPHGYPAIVYSGSVERIDFGERKEDKGFCLVTLEKKSKTKHEFIKTPTRPFLQIEIILNGTDDPTAQILQELKNHDLAHAVVKILYHIPQGKKDLVDLPTIQRACATAHHVAGILPVRKFEARTARAAIHVDMNVSDLLDSFFSSKPEYKDKKRRLIEKTLSLMAEQQEEKELD